MFIAGNAHWAFREVWWNLRRAPIGRPSQISSRHRFGWSRDGSPCNVSIGFIIKSHRRPQIQHSAPCTESALVARNLFVRLSIFTEYFFSVIKMQSFWFWMMCFFFNDILFKNLHIKTSCNYCWGHNDSNICRWYNSRIYSNLWPWSLIRKKT